jgi:hypothetical protein
MQILGEKMKVWIGETRRDRAQGKVEERKQMIAKLKFNSEKKP